MKPALFVYNLICQCLVLEIPSENGWASNAYFTLRIRLRVSGIVHLLNVIQPEFYPDTGSSHMACFIVINLRGERSPARLSLTIPFNNGYTEDTFQEVEDILRDGG